ncbi:MAG: ABC-2 family transporter protein [Phycisphaeraceae bacterium]
MPRYLRTLRLFWSAAIAAEMEYRVNFTLAVLNSLGGLAGGLFALDLFYRSGAQLGGWSWEQALVVFGLFTLLNGVSLSFLNPNLNRIVEYVHRGTLDFVLLKPIDSQFWLSLRNASPWGLPDILFGLGLLTYSGIKLGVGPAAYLLGIVPVLLAVVVLYSLWFVFASLSIWYVKVWNATEVLRSLLDAGRFPVAAFPAAVRIFFTVVVPVAFLTTVPAEVMLGQVGAEWLAIEAAIAIGLFLFTRWFWKFALRYYTSASS